mgnify:CR=1 FL=1
MKILLLVCAFTIILISKDAFSSEDLNQLQLNQAAVQHYSASDFMLNKAYSQLMLVLEGKRKDQLKLAQRAWIKFRDLNAKLVSSSYAGGSIEPLIYTQALINLTVKRTEELTRIYLNEITP